MSTILKVGQVLKVDNEGFIVNESSKDKIKPPWSEIVDALIDAYVKHFGDKLHSIYMRGSVARSSAVEGVSDVDSFAVVLGKEEGLDLSWTGGLRKALEEKYLFCKGIEFVCISYEELLNYEDDAYSSWRMIVKTQSACVWGEDISPALPKYRPGNEMVIQSPYIRGDIKRFVNGLRIFSLLNKIPFALQFLKSRRVDYDGIIKRGCQWVMKRVVRTGFEIVMEEEQVYTRDLYPCYEIFSKYFPERERDMRKALELAVDPSSNYKELLTFLNGFGGWITSRAELKFGKPKEMNSSNSSLISLLRRIIKLFWS